MDRMILPLLGALFLLLLGVGGTLAYDRHGPLPCCRVNLGFWHPGFDLPPSLAQQRDAAVAGSLLAQKQATACTTTLDDQNAGIRRDAIRSAAAMAAAAATLASKQAEAAEWRRRASSVLLQIPPMTETPLARWLQADAVVTGSGQ